MEGVKGYLGKRLLEHMLGDLDVETGRRQHHNGCEEERLWHHSSSFIAVLRVSVSRGDESVCVCVCLWIVWVGVDGCAGKGKLDV